MADPVGVAVEWLAATGSPNWVVALALLTHPATWSDTLHERSRQLLNRIFPGGGS